MTWSYLDHNFQLLDGQRSYMLIYDLRRQSKLFERPARACCIYPFNTTECLPQCYECTSFGVSISILQHKHDDVVAKIQLSTYEVKHNEHEYYVDELKTKKYNFGYSGDGYDVTPFMLSALQHAYSPFSSVGGVKAISDLLSYETILEKTKTNLLERSNAISWLYDTSYSLDRQHTKVLLNADVSSAHDARDYINNTYVNIVHDCDRICAQTVLSDEHGFMPSSKIKEYGLTCTYRLLELKSVQPRKLTSSQRHHSSNTIIHALLNGFLASVGIVLLFFVTFVFRKIYQAQTVLHRVDRRETEHVEHIVMNTLNTRTLVTNDVTNDISLHETEERLLEEQDHNEQVDA